MWNHWSKLQAVVINGSQLVVNRVYLGNTGLDVIKMTQYSIIYLYVIKYNAGVVDDWTRIIHFVVIGGSLSESIEIYKSWLER